LALELREWLDGSSERERRHEEAESLAAEGREAAKRFERLQAEVGEAEAAAGEEERKYHAWQPIAEKQPLLEARKRAEDLNTEGALAFAETLKYLQAALVQEETNPTARAVLAVLWKGRLENHERRNERVDAAYALTMVRRYDDGPLATFVKGEGSLSLASEPSGAEVRLFRYVERDGILKAREERRLGVTPLSPVPLPMGSYLCVVTKPGFRDVRYPVHITRNREWKGRIRLRTDEEIGEGFVYVPAGPFVYGEGKDTRTLELPDFAIAKYPVTRADYAEFLTALDPEEATERMSRNEYDGVYFERGEKGVFLPINKIEGKAREWSERMFGEDFVERLPASCMSWDDARAYCEWKTRTTAKQWRLPTEQEREKAARGVDGRRFPWGDLEDASLAKCRDSREVNPQPEPIGTFKTAESVYGMGDAAGGVWDWTDSWFDEDKGLRALRGGSWNYPSSSLRAASRFWNLPVVRLTLFGFRCARGL
ncbi:MAG: SUMF1/EgtB/PvdO family nonheme iron enzyme, partial [Planctomycetes bacterium]|nr:SUMF1/EgtB/PvdO family nonheme iron enzyme [Planctomycetota bacterium]